MQKVLRDVIPFSHSDNDKTPLVSVIIPAFGRVDKLARALRSVANQTYKHWEIIVVDDGSPEPITKSILGENCPNLTLLRNEQNLGAGAARNAAIRAANGKLVAFLDSDDEWLSDKLQIQVQGFIKESAANPDLVGMVSGFRLLALGKGSSAQTDRIPKPMQEIGRLAGGCDMSPGSTLLVRTSVFSELGGFCESMRRFEDWDWLIRLSERYSLGCCSEILSLVHLGRRAGVEALRLPCVLMRDRHLGRFLEINRGYGRQFLSTLSYELAVASFSDGRFILALSYFLKSAVRSPGTALSLLPRVIRGIVYGVS